MSWLKYLFVLAVSVGCTAFNVVIAAWAVAEGRLAAALVSFVAAGYCGFVLTRIAYRGKPS